ncbi:MAG: hypothetical protein CL676_01285 [Bdellovibrionaceae bacterium]|nr:hypothetical protein [Pseudobdellovibrionaceae bacterium]|tara:strand:+ start:10716 stop:12227 length:1512 start_codon:yes stop_codon:yes gene_type:complete
MKRVALKLEHRYQNKLIRAHLLEGEDKVLVVGSSRGAHLRLMGDGVSGIHAAFERSGEEWTVSDLGSEEGTWINKRPIVEHKISGATVIHIGGHQIKATPQAMERPLFHGAKTAQSESEGETYHQFVVLKDGHLVRSELVAPNSDCSYQIKGQLKHFKAPEDYNWVESEVDGYVIRQRLVKSQVMEQDLKERMKSSLEPRVHGPMISALLVFLLIFGFSFLMPGEPEDELKTVMPPANQFTRMIFDSKKIKSKKAQAEKLRKNIAGQSKQGVKKSAPGGDQGKVAGGSKSKRPGAKVVSRIRAAGLGALIGKISKRAAKNTELLEAAGVSPDQKSGKAFSLGGGSSLDKVGPRQGTGGGGTKKIAGLGTSGKGGGSSGYKGSGALSLGNVGNAEVGVIEEETEVDGGLDRDVIARVIKSQLGQIRYCYERQLSANPELYGKVLVKFTIGGTGQVVAQMVGNTSLNNAMVEGCILRRIAGWKFPQPKGGTNVLVSYPFLFKSTR